MFGPILRSLLPRQEPTLFRRYQTEYGPYLKQNSVQTSESFYRTLIQTTAPYLTKDSVVLDAGCGLGRSTIDIGNQNVRQVIGIDNDSQLIYEANAIAGGHREQLLSYPCNGNYRFIQGDALHLPFENESFTFVSCINLIDRVDNPAKCVQELCRVLKKNGILFMVDPYDWDESYTAPVRWVETMKVLVKDLPVTEIYEKDHIPFSIFINPRLTLAYKNHLMVFKKT